MSYNIGQFRSFDMQFDDYLQKQTLNIKNKEVDSFAENLKFIDKAADVELRIQNNYYLRFRVTKLKDELNIKLKAINSNQGKEQLLETFYVPGYTTDQEQQYSYFEIIFSTSDLCNQLVWELVRTLEDYKGNGREITIQCESFGIVTNVLTQLAQSYTNIQYLKKIGIQGPPLLLLCINKEQIRLGKNGIYELNNGMNITSIGFVPKSEKDLFIMDFEYQINNSEDQEGGE